MENNEAAAEPQQHLPSPPPLTAQEEQGESQDPTSYSSSGLPASMEGVSAEESEGETRRQDNEGVGGDNGGLLDRQKKERMAALTALVVSTAAEVLRVRESYYFVSSFVFPLRALFLLPDLFTYIPGMCLDCSMVSGVQC